MDHHQRRLHDNQDTSEGEDSVHNRDADWIRTPEGDQQCKWLHSPRFDPNSWVLETRQGPVCTFSEHKKRWKSSEDWEELTRQLPAESRLPSSHRTVDSTVSDNLTGWPLVWYFQQVLMVTSQVRKWKKGERKERKKKERRGRPKEREKDTEFSFSLFSFSLTLTLTGRNLAPLCLVRIITGDIIATSIRSPVLGVDCISTVVVGFHFTVLRGSKGREQGQDWSYCHCDGWWRWWIVQSHHFSIHSLSLFFCLSDTWLECVNENES